MKEKILTLENFNEIAFDLIKKENGNSEVIKYEVNSSDRLSESVIEEIFKMRNEENISFKEATKEVIENEPDLMFILDDKIDYLAETVVEKYSQYDENNDDFYDLKMEIRDFITNNFEKDYSIDEILKNTPINELSVFLKEPTSDYPEDSERNNVPFGEFRYTDELDIIKDEYSSIAFLIQSQGYEVEDLYNKEKVENSKFLKSLLNELEELPNGKEGSVVFSKINGYNLEQFIELEESQKNISIPKDGILVGIYSGDFDKILPLGIELEKDIVVDRKHVEIVSEFSEDAENLLIDEKKYMVGDKNRSKFKETEEKGFEMHEFDKEEVFEKLETFNQKKAIDEIEK